MKKNQIFFYAIEGSSLRAFQIFNPSTLPTSLVVGVSCLESSKIIPFFQYFQTGLVLYQPSPIIGSNIDFG
jgi:hypothetical protein